MIRETVGTWISMFFKCSSSGSFSMSAWTGVLRVFKWCNGRTSHSIGKLSWRSMPCSSISTSSEPCRRQPLAVLSVKVFCCPFNLSRSFMSLTRTLILLHAVLPFHFFQNPLKTGRKTPDIPPDFFTVSHTDIDYIKRDIWLIFVKMQLPCDTSCLKFWFRYGNFRYRFCARYFNLL